MPTFAPAIKHKFTDRLKAGKAFKRRVSLIIKRSIVKGGKFKKKFKKDLHGWEKGCYLCPPKPRGKGSSLQGIF